MIKFTLFISLLVKFIQAECLLPTNQFKGILKVKLNFPLYHLILYLFVFVLRPITKKFL